MSDRTMGQQLARAIFEYGSLGNRATRIQFKAGKWPDRETDLGGLCEDALARVIDGWIADQPEFLDVPAFSESQSNAESGKDPER